jgi:heterogeneous nuclear ribonucleoprotein K
MKRPRGDKFETRLLVPSKVAGSIIGKGGSNIQKLRADNNANVRIPDCPGPERVMTILTSDCESAVKVVEQSLPYMTEDAVRGGPGGAANSSPDAAIELRFLIHQSIVGGIIGRAGFKIKEIRDNSGANIKVYQNCAPQSTDRCVSIQGAADKIAKAAGEVLNVVVMTEIKGPDQQYDPINFDSFYSTEYGGYGSEMETGFGGGPGGAGGRGGRGGGGRGGGGGGRGNFGGGQDMNNMGGFGGVRGGMQGNLSIFIRLLIIL